jgi:hypothetical protein
MHSTAKRDRVVSEYTLYASIGRLDAQASICQYLAMIRWSIMI